MKFIEAPDDRRNLLFHRMVSEHGLVEVGIHPVLFGYRVKAGFVGSGWSEIEWCAGGNAAVVSGLRQACLHILSTRSEHRECFAVIPRMTEVKPFFRDMEFMQWLVIVSEGMTPGRPLDLTAARSAIESMML